MSTRYRGLCAMLAAGVLCACGSPEPVRQDAARESAPPQASPPTIEEETPRAETLLLAVVSSEPADAIDRYTPLARFLARAAGYSHGRVRAFTTVGVALSELCEARVDLFLDTAFASALALRACQARLLLVAAKNDTLRYESVIFVRRGSPYRTLLSLRGQLILFEDASSTSAYALPRALIEHAGIAVVPADRASADAIAYIFVEDELNIIGGVVHGRAAAGALSSNDMDDFEGAEVTEIARTAPIPRQLVVAAPGLDPGALDRVHRAALAAHTTADVAPVLDAARIGRFDRVTEQDAAHVGRLVTILEAQEESP